MGFGSGRFCRMVLVLLMVGYWTGVYPALADSYFIYGQYGGTWHDANKTADNPEDDLMCWAAAASNVLAWGGWGTAVYNTADKIFKHFQDHWTDNSGVISWAWKWWLNGSPPPYWVLSYPDVPGGGNFYPTLNFTDYYRYASYGDLLSLMDSWMHQGYGIGLTLGGRGSHAVTAWGFNYNLVNGTKQYTGIYLTDSDDGVTALRLYPLTWNGTYWYLGGNYSGWLIAGVSGFKYRLAPGTSNPINGGDYPGGINPAPLPATAILLGFGGLLLLVLNQRPRKI